MTRSLVAAAPATLLLAAVAGCTPDVPPPEAAPTRVVTLATATDTLLAAPIRATGVLGALEEADLAFTVGGLVREVTVRPGDRVRAGAVLARLDATPVEADLAAAEAALAKAERDLARAERLVADSVVARAVVDDARTARDAAAARVRAAGFARRTAVITAPADGVVLERRVDPGAVVSAGSAVLRVAASGAGSVFRVALPDRDVLRVQPGDAAEVTLDAAPGDVLRGRVVEVGAAPAARSGTWVALVAVPGAAALPRGLTGTAVIRSGRAEPVRLVPVEAVVEAAADSAVVFVVQEGVARRRAVRIGGLEGGRVRVQDGLDAGARVIVAGAAYLVDGDTVQAGDL